MYALDSTGAGWRSREASLPTREQVSSQTTDLERLGIVTVIFYLHIKKIMRLSILK